MDVNELYNEFNLVYDNISSHQARGLDKYEISVYMTKAQDILEDTIYNDFEHSEEARKKLSNMLITERIVPSTGNDSYKLYPSSVLFKLDNNVRYIVNEKIKMNNNADRCVRDKFIDIQPCSHDEVDRIIKNPFRYNLNRALRLDTSIGDDKYSEILFKDNHIEYYEIRYIKNADPIILTDLAQLGASINGRTAVNGASLTPELHRQIVEIAAKMAIADYKG